MIDYDAMVVPNPGYEDCKCMFGLLRDKKYALMGRLKIKTGFPDSSVKGETLEFDESRTLNWWKPESDCDAVGGYDLGNYPPHLKKEDGKAKKPICRDI